MVLRTNFGMTSREIAEQIGVDEGHVSKVLKGRKKPSALFASAVWLLLQLTEKAPSRQTRVDDLQYRIDQLERRIQELPDRYRTEKLLKKATQKP